jgi:branched-chain amino acid transport system substrate-binding protein
MAFHRRSLIKGAGATAVASAFGVLSRGGARAQGAPIKIGVLSDFSGMFADASGAGSLACVRQAVQEFANRDIHIEVMSADHQNKPDVAANIARRWYDVDGVDVIVDVPTSGAALAVSGVSRDKNRVLLASGPASSALTGEAGSPNTIHWTYNAAMLSASTAGGMINKGFDTWFFIVVDAPFGSEMERNTTAFVERAGGHVVGSTRVPLNVSADIASPLGQAQTNKAKVVALATAGAMTTAAIRQAAELKPQGVRVAALQMLISDVHALGLATCQKVVLTETFYWNLNDRTRAFSSRVQSALGDRRPGMVQAGCYSAVTHYLKAVAAMGVSQAKGSGRDVVKRMKAMPTDDDAFGPGRIRDDGRKIHPAYLFEVKAPSESHGPWDYYNLLHTTSADAAFGFNPNTGCSECGSGCRCSNTCSCSSGCCPN